MALEKERGPRPGAGDVAVVIGAGRSGMAAARLAASKGALTRLLEKNPQALEPDKMAELKASGVELFTGPHEAPQFADADFIIPSPGIPMAVLSPFLPKEARPEIISELELAWRFLDNEPVLAVTGTSGKTTTASLAAAMLKAQGYSVFLGGNIGTPLSEYVLDSRVADALVLETSSFQLQGCSTFCPRAAIMLNISPNHLDYHKDMEEYLEAKFRIFRCQDEGDLAILDESLRPLAEKRHIAARKIWLAPHASSFSRLRLLGEHNLLNAEAAWQACKFFGVSLENASRAAAAFMPLPHRLEKVAEKNRVLYVNDSKCTTPAALEVALKSFSQPVRLLCGGKFKGGDLSKLSGLVKEKVAEIALFGASRDVFEKAWQEIVPMSWSQTLKDAVLKLKESARPGDVILLAPATSSYDLYENYMERGDDFRRIVEGLA